MGLYNRIPFRIAHIEDHPIPEYAGVINQDVKAAELVKGTFNDMGRALRCCNGILVGYRCATRLLYFRHHQIGD
jgi:hypothetical protein